MKKKWICLVMLLGGVFFLLISCTQRIFVPIPIAGRTYDITLYLNLPENGLTVENLADGETVTVRKRTDLNNEYIPIIEDGSYIFGGWFLDSSGLIPYGDVSDGMIVYAAWISVWDGQSSDTDSIASQYTEDVIVIKDSSELMGLSDIVNGVTAEAEITDTTFSGKTIKLINDIDLAGHEWTPIGLSDSFRGSVVGKEGGTSIKGLMITNLHAGSNLSNTNYAGLFGSVEDASFSNLNISGEISVNSTDYSASSIYAGAIAGYVQGGTSIENCTSDVRISIKSKYSQAGGIVGLVSGDNNRIAGCENTGDITSDGTQETMAGGVIGRIYPGSCEITGCVNRGNIMSAGFNETNHTSSYAGGIAGAVEEVTEQIVNISDCQNYGNIHADDNPDASNPAITTAGGIIGLLNNLQDASKIYVSSSVNNGSVSTRYYRYDSYVYSGGIIGYIAHRSRDTDSLVSISGNTNNGQVKAENMISSDVTIAGGVTSIIDKPAAGYCEIIDNMNTGTLEGELTGYVAGASVAINPLIISGNRTTVAGLEEIELIQ